MPTTTQTSASIHHLLQAITAVRALMPRPPGWVYTSIEELLLAHGHDMPWAPLPPAINTGTPRNCFADAQFAFLAQGDTELHYCEGYASTGLLPVHHAWLVTAAGVVVDRTWHTLLRPGEEPCYVGVVFDDTYARARIQEFRRAREPRIESFIDRPGANWPLLAGTHPLATALATYPPPPAGTGAQ